MAKGKYEKVLNKRQLDVIEELFNGNLSESEIMKAFDINTKIFKRWLDDKLFIDELKFRLSSSVRRSKFLLAKHKPFAAAKLIELANSEKEETARKACLDILAIDEVDSKKEVKADDGDEKRLPIEKLNSILQAIGGCDGEGKS